MMPNEGTNIRIMMNTREKEKTQRTSSEEDRLLT